MKRRDFIKYSLLGTGGLLAAPVFPDRLNASNKIVGNSFSGKVIIIGAGVAGIYAAHLLSLQGIDVTVLEAADVYGGRVKSLKDFSDFPIELGGEKIYGKKSAFSDLAKSCNASLLSYKGDEYYSLDGFLNTETILEDDADFRQVLALSETFADYDGPDMSLEQYGMQQGLTKRVLPVYNSLIANKHAASLGKLSILGMKDLEGKWKGAGRDPFVLKDRSILSIFEEKCSAAISKIKLKCPVSSIDYSGTTINITDKNGGTYTADKVLITVPISILKSNDIQFTPALPSEKISSFSKIGMSAGMKIILKFNKPFWKPDTASIYGPAYVPEFYVTGLGRSNFKNVLTAYINGESAEHLSFEEKEATNSVIKELDKIFGSTAASRSLIDSYVMDWFRQPYIRGSASYPLIGYTPESRQVAAAPVSGKLFFAGEAMNTEGQFATIQGALETAQIAVNNVLKS